MRLPCRIIAEAGVNHDGDVDRALELVDIAAKAGADYVKFQTFHAEALSSPKAELAGYQARNTSGSWESQLDMLKRLQLSRDAHVALMDSCRAQGIGFLSTPFDHESLSFLTDDLGLQQIKLGSGELTNAPLLYAAARSGAEIILSTGMGTLAEVEAALGVLAYGMSGGAQPGQDAFAEAYRTPAIRSVLAERVTLLHCTTEYPAPVDETNLHAMATLSQAFGLPVGYSDHTEGLAVSFASVAMGARILEKHFTHDRNAAGPDHAASLSPQALQELVAGIRDVEAALGDGVKQPGKAEFENRTVARKSLLATRDLPHGHRLGVTDVVAMRPGTGLSPMAYWDVIGATLDGPVAKGDLIRVGSVHD
ncbi:MAG: N-acetylneuraminate synthase [Pseudomonadota bacterium]